MTGESWGRLSLIIVAGYLYLGVFLCLSVFVFRDDGAFVKFFPANTCGLDYHRHDSAA